MSYQEGVEAVENSVVEIRSLVPPDCWQHCPGMENPADIPLRGLIPTEFEEKMEF